MLQGRTHCAPETRSSDCLSPDCLSPDCLSPDSRGPEEPTIERIMPLEIVQLEVGLGDNFCEVIGCTETGGAGPGILRARVRRRRCHRQRSPSR